MSAPDARADGIGRVTGDEESAALRVPLAGLAIVAAAASRWAAGFDATSAHPWLALAAWVASMGFAAAACRAPAAPAPVPPDVRWRAGDAALALAILALALALRGFALGERPMLGGDEAGWGVVAREILAGGGNPFGFGYYDWPALGEYVTALSLALGGTTIEALRAPSAVAGSLTAALVALYGVRLAGRLAGTAAGVVAATALVHVHLSRQGIHNVFDALCALVALAALERGWVERRRGAFVAAGIAIGVAQQFYASARLLPLIVGAWIVLRLVVEGRHAAARWRDVAAMAFVAAVAAWPQVTLALHDTGRWLAPIARQAVPWSLASASDDPSALVAATLPRLRDAALALVAVEMRGAFAPPVPLLPPVAAAFFVAGLVALARRWRSPSSELLALWIAAGVAIAALSESTPAGHRYVIVVPAVALVAGIGVAACANLARRAGPRAALATAALALAALAIEGASQAQRYFARMPPWTGAARDVNGEVALDFAARIGAAPAGARAVMLGAPRMWYRGFHHFAYLHPATVARDVEAGAAAGPAVAAACGAASPGARAASAPVVDCLIAVLPHRERDLDGIRASVTVVRETAVAAGDGLPLYRLVEACGACGAPASATAPADHSPAVSSTR